ncbi:MAG: DUF5069 domain-containing protein [Actinomycetota bacterium]|nr:DUF5069 domain-containing protein [Actinomycetota bacterium]
MSPTPSDTIRPPQATLAGYAWLPRMLDKARAELAGAQTELPFGCPIDHTCMARLGINPDTVRELVTRHGNDDDAILAELRQRGIPTAAQATCGSPRIVEG